MHKKLGLERQKSIEKKQISDLHALRGSPGSLFTGVGALTGDARKRRPDPAPVAGEERRGGGGVARDGAVAAAARGGGDGGPAKVAAAAG